MRVKLLVVSPYTKDANSFYRAVGPWSYFSKVARQEGIDFDFSVAGDEIGRQGVSWSEVGQFDAVFMHRPCREDDLTILRIARNMNVPVWVEYDDWLFDVPYWNPHKPAYDNPGLQNVIATCIAAADVVSVTTSALYDLFSRVNSNVVIIPNMYRSDLYPYRAEQVPQRKPEIAWRGSSTHDADLMSVMDAWDKMPAKVNFWGGAPWQVQQKMQPGAYQIVGSQDPFMYMRSLYQSSPRVLVVPLVDCLFNRCKSNIAYQEAMHAGAVCVAPDLSEWKRPGVITYKAGDAQSFLDSVNGAFSMSDDHLHDAAFHGFEAMKQLYDAPVVNQIRKATLSAMLSTTLTKNARDPWDNLLGSWSKAMIKGSAQKNVASG